MRISSARLETRSQNSCARSANDNLTTGRLLRSWRSRSFWTKTGLIRDTCKTVPRISLSPSPSALQGLTNGFTIRWATCTGSRSSSREQGFQPSWATDESEFERFVVWCISPKLSPSCSIGKNELNQTGYQLKPGQ